jgi:hypothetical protein
MVNLCLWSELAFHITVTKCMNSEIGQHPAMGERQMATLMLLPARIINTIISFKWLELY